MAWVYLGRSNSELGSYRIFDIEIRVLFLGPTNSTPILTPNSTPLLTHPPDWLFDQVRAQHF